MYVQTMKGFVHMEKEKFERLARQKQAQDEKLLKVMEMVAAPSPMRTPLGEKQTTRDVSIADMFHSVVPYWWDTYCAYDICTCTYIVVSTGPLHWWWCHLHH